MRCFSLFFSNDPATTEIYTLSLHDALPISGRPRWDGLSRKAERRRRSTTESVGTPRRSEEHTSELQSLRHLVCRLLLEKKKQKKQQDAHARRQSRLGLVRYSDGGSYGDDMY